MLSGDPGEVARELPSKLAIQSPLLYTARASTASASDEAHPAALLGPEAGVSAARSQVYFFSSGHGDSKKMYVTRTSWAELRECTGLVVRSI